MLVIVLVLLRLLFTNPVNAENSPILISPANNSTITSIPTFSWQTVPESTGYNILIDDEPTVTSPYAKTPYYPTNPSYSPKTLNSGTYYWKVKAKDSNGSWGSFSNIWSFTLQSTPLPPTPSPASSPVPTPTLIPTPSLTPASFPTPKPISSFTISDTPSQINANQSFNVSINLLLPNNLNTVYYLAGAFKKVDGTRYFGLTKNINNWIKYGDETSTQYQITTNGSGNWTGTLEVKPDTSDSDYKGSGDYSFKVGRYTSSGSSPLWSNEIALKINDTDTSSNTSTPQPTSINNPEASPLPTKLLSSKSKPTQLKSFYQIASVAAATTASQPATSSGQVNIKNKSQMNPLILAGLILIFAGVSLIGYIYLRKDAKISI